MAIFLFRSPDFPQKNQTRNSFRSATVSRPTKVLFDTFCNHSNTSEVYRNRTDGFAVGRNAFGVKRRRGGHDQWFLANFVLQYNLLVLSE